MEPAYTTAQPENLYPVANGWAYDYNPGASQEAVVAHRKGQPFRRPLQGLGAYPGQPTAHVDRVVPGPRSTQLVHGEPPAYVYPGQRNFMGLGGLGGFGSVDLRPYVTFYTSAGAVPVAIDPTSLLEGNVVFPIVGNVPYVLDVFGAQMVLHVPYYGDAVVPLFGGGSGTGSVNIPGLGDVPYEVSIGIPEAASVPGGIVTTLSILGALGGSILPLVLIGGLAFLLLKK